MMKLTRLGHVALRVADVERSKKFYGEVVLDHGKHSGAFPGRVLRAGR